jgi:hypothetical protein
MVLLGGAQQRLLTCGLSPKTLMTKKWLPGSGKAYVYVLGSLFIRRVRDIILIFDPVYGPSGFLEWNL